MRKSDLKRAIEKIGLSPKKSLGQNFLVSDSIAERIVNAADVSSKDFVVEFGPGMGMVTEKILKRGADLLVIEIDKKLVAFLQDRFSSFENFHIIENDFFKLTQSQYMLDKARVKFVSNPPYRGAKKLLRNLCTTNSISSCVLTLQKEVAQILFSKPGESSANRLTYYAHYRFKPRKLFDIPSSFFYPEPGITSTSVLLSPRKDNNIKANDEKFFFKTLDLILQKRKRKLTNCLSSAFNMEKEEITKIMEKSKIRENARPTDLSVEQMVNVSNLLKQEIQKN